ncbi:tetratricopeptide repeat protein [Actinosynnema sp. NPDC020468]|uniref:tetratricopeptide repeat protein n=1 Tax=Actinosynnema sp. NPDC020468 TaxID=3154488 RepID=UPI0033DD6C71
MSKLLAVAALAAGAALLVSLPSAPDTPRTPAPVGVAAETSLHRSISAAQARLRRTPADFTTWAALGSAYVEQARVTGDPAYYAKAQGALETSLRHGPDNGWALIGLGALANARHDFATARDLAQRAVTALPDTASARGVLADATTQLGAAAEATEAVQRMLDLEPGVPSFTRAAYDLEQHGRVDAAREALERALEASVAPSDVVFCRYHLGELAFDNGDPEEAARQYDAGLSADPRDVTLLQGKAKVAAAAGRWDDALAGYHDLVDRVPLPQYRHEYANLLRASGRGAEAAEQFSLLDKQFALIAAAGGQDDLTASAVAADRGDAAAALTLASAEWSRRHHPLVADALAWALHLHGRDAEALDLAEVAASSGWRNAVFAFHRGTVLAALGRRAEAATALDTALAINPHFSFTDAGAARATLAGLR